MNIKKYLGLLTAALYSIATIAPTAIAATSNPDARMVNISSRAFVDSGNNVLIAGFVVTGSGQKKVLIRGVGPGLATVGLQNGILKAAKIELHTNDANGKDMVLFANTSWDGIPTDGDAVKTAGASVGAFPLTAGSKDAARVVFLFPGSYTVILSAADGVAGVGLVEVYEL